MRPHRACIDPRTVDTDGITGETSLVQRAFTMCCGHSNTDAMYYLAPPAPAAVKVCISVHDNINISSVVLTTHKQTTLHQCFGAAAATTLVVAVVVVVKK